MACVHSVLPCPHTYGALPLKKLGVDGLPTRVVPTHEVMPQREPLHFHDLECDHKEYRR